MKPSLANTKSETAAMKLVALELRLTRKPGSLLSQVEVALADQGRPLRWAITAVSGEELQIEAVVVQESP